MRRYYISHPDEPLGVRMREGVGVLRRCLETEKHITLCFNGGKDCTVVLHLARLALFECLLGLSEEDGPDVDYDMLYDTIYHKLHAKSSTVLQGTTPIASPAMLQLPKPLVQEGDNRKQYDVVYRWKRPATTPFKQKEFIKHFTEKITLVNFVPLDAPDTPKELDDFVEDLEELLGLNVITIQAPTLIDGIKKQIENDGVKVFILGVRLDDLSKTTTTTTTTQSKINNNNNNDNNDNNNSSALIQASTPPYPPLTRVFPILRWHCQDVWDFLIRFGVAYCPLYRQGYTSIGSSTSTPNAGIIARARGKRVKDLRPTVSEEEILKGKTKPEDHSLLSHVETLSGSSGINTDEFSSITEDKRNKKTDEGIKTIKSILEEERGLNMKGIEKTHAVWMPVTEDERAGREEGK